MKDGSSLNGVLEYESATRRPVRRLARLAVGLWVISMIVQLFLFMVMFAYGDGPGYRSWNTSLSVLRPLTVVSVCFAAGWAVGGRRGGAFWPSLVPAIFSVASFCLAWASPFMTA